MSYRFYYLRQICRKKHVTLTTNMSSEICDIFSSKSLGPVVNEVLNFDELVPQSFQNMDHAASMMARLHIDTAPQTDGPTVSLPLRVGIAESLRRGSCLVYHFNLPQAEGVRKEKTQKLTIE